MAITSMTRPTMLIGEIDKAAAAGNVGQQATLIFKREHNGGRAAFSR